MSKMKFKDINDKQFELSLNDITDISGDLGTNIADIKDSTDQTIKFETEIVDSKGLAVNVSKLLDEVKEKKANMPIALDVLFEATHSGNNHNYYNYHSDSMEGDSQSWLTPFAKPFIKNHDSHEEPLGRAKSVKCSQSQINPNRDSMDVTYRISDAVAVEKFLDGRYKTMSIGGSVGHITCGTCQKDILKDGVITFCGHMRGETYDGQKCYWHGTNISYNEGSVVNNPADDWAQVKKITLVTPDDATKDNEETQDEMDARVLAEIAALADENNETDDEKLVRETAEAKVISDAKELKDAEDLAAAKVLQDELDAQAIEDAKIPPTIESLTIERDILLSNQDSIDANYKVASEAKDAELKVANDCITTLNKSAVIANENIKALTDEKVIADEKIASVTEDAKAQRSTNIKLAVLNKKLMAQRIVDLELLSNLLTDEKKEARLTDLIAKGAKELTTMIDSLVINTLKTVRDMATAVKNPGLANPKDKKSSLEDEIDETQGTDIKSVNVADYTNDIINSMYK